MTSKTGRKPARSEQKFNLPGVFWVILIVVLVPALVPVIEQVFPASAYQWSAVLVVVLVSVAKTVEIVYRRQIDDAMAQAPMPAAAADVRGETADGDDYTWSGELESKPRPALAALIFG